MLKEGKQNGKQIKKGWQKAMGRETRERRGELATALLWFYPSKQCTTNMGVLGVNRSNSNLVLIPIKF